jgi:hypothetical protein
MTYTASRAEISTCKQYRYVLWRSWGGGEGTAVFIGLNPSTADEQTDDPTLRRCVSLARSWGMSGIVMVNLFAYRSTDPAKLKIVSNPVGPENNRHILNCCHTANQIIAAWGNRGKLSGRDREVVRLLKSRHLPLFCLGTTKLGQPRHPLYVRRDVDLLPYQG